MRLLDTLHQAWRGLGDHRLRTTLSILGITIGISAVMAVSTVSKGGNHVVYSELETFGLNSLWVYRDRTQSDPNRRQPPGTGLNEDDYRALRARADTFGIARLSPQVRYQARAVALTRLSRSSDVQLLGVDRDYLTIVNDQVADGRTFDPNDIDSAMSVAVLGPDVVERLFDPSEAVLGSSVRLDGHKLRVIGILAPKSRDFLASIGSVGGQNANDRVLLPYSTLQQLNGDDQISTLHLEAQRFETADASAQRIRQWLSDRHDGRFVYGAETMAQHIRTTERILGGVAIIGIIAASISLLVGGMGIMNMMSTSVIERTREIGIRKALGASQQDILWQFLFEAAIISLAGGLLGLVFGAGSSVLLAVLSGFPVMPSVPGIIGALVVSILVGLLSGLYPARRAAQLDPVAALRQNA